MRNRFLVIAAIASVSTIKPAGLRPASAELVSQSDHRFRVTHVVTLTAERDEVFRALHEDIGTWWSSAHSFSGDASNMSIELKPHGWFVETLPDGGFARHLEVVRVQPGRVIVMSGGLGPLQTMPVQGVMTWAVRETDDGSEFTLDYRVSGECDPTLSNLAGPVDGVLAEQVKRFKAHVEKEKP